jgi:hypothetical protein
MADVDACDLIEEWARGALDLPDDAVVRASSAGDGYSLVIELPEGTGAQQDAEGLQSAVVSALEANPTLGGRLSEVTASPAGVDLVAFGETGARSMFELRVAGEDGEAESDEGAGEATGDDESDDDGDEDGGDEDGGDEDEGSDGDDESDQGDDGDSDRDDDTQKSDP